MAEEFWNYSRAEDNFPVLPEGDYRIRIKSAEKAVASTGNKMLSLQFEVSGSNSIIFHNIVFLADRPEITNRSLTRFFDAFPEIQEGKFDLQSWIGKVGAAHLKHDEYNGKTRAVIHYFISKKQQSELPAWVEPGNNQPAKSSGLVDVTNSDDLPF